LRFAVLWRKRSNGTQSEKGNRWIERLLSFRQTCRLRSQPTFPLLVDTMNAYFKDQSPNLNWLA
jgi:transposase